MNRRDLFKMIAAGGALLVLAPDAVALTRPHREIGELRVESLWRADLKGVPMMFYATVWVREGGVPVEQWDYASLAPPDSTEEQLEQYRVKFIQRAIDVFSRIPAHRRLWE